MTSDIDCVQAQATSAEAPVSPSNEGFRSIPPQGGGAVGANPTSSADNVDAAPTLFAELGPTDGASRFLTAVGAGATCSALRSVAVFFGEAAKNHAPSLEVGLTPAWLEVPRGTQAAVKAIFADDSRSEARATLGAALSHDAFPAPFSNFLFIARFPDTSARRKMLDRMTLVLTLKVAQCGTVTPKSVGNGLQQCYRALAAKQPTAWSTIADQAPIDIAQIDRLLSEATQKVVREFLSDCRALLSIEFSAPSIEPPPRADQSLAKPVDREVQQRASDGAASAPRSEPSDPDTATDDDGVSNAPSILAYTREAQFAPISAKAGVALQWNCIATPELRSLVANVTPHLSSDNPRLVSCAVLFYISLLTKANGKHARRTPTRMDPNAPDLAISIHGGGLLTSHDARVQARRPDHVVAHHRVNTIQWPQRLMDILRAWEVAWGERPEIGDYIDLNAGSGGLSNAEYNKFLRECGDMAHVAEPTRVANGLGLAVLELTGSDMYASLGALHVELAAPSADYYFSPRASEVHKMMDKVYRDVGLGPAVPLPEDACAMRLGAQKWVPVDRTRDGWSRLEADIIRAYKRVRRWKNNLEGGAALDELSRQCCSALVIRDAGRGTNPQRMSVASMASNPSWYVVDDKYIEGIKRARLLPHTELSRALLQIFLDAKRIAYKRMGWKEDGALDPIFGMTAKGRDFGLRSDWVPLDADALQTITTEYFSADRNFARNQFVTSMGEELVDRWLVRALTGHGTWLLTSFSWTMNVAPEEAMNHLRDALNEHGGRMFGDAKALLDLAKSAPSYVAPRLPLEIQIDPAGESTGDPLSPISRQCLIDHALVGVVRHRIAEGCAAACSYATTLLARLAVDGLPSLEAAIDATLAIETVRKVGEVDGVAWRRRHYVHTFWLPSQSLTNAVGTLAAQAPPPSRKRVLREAADFLRRQPAVFGWPEDDLAVLSRFANACELWRRLELPPSMCAMSSSKVETACLSPISLERIATNGAFPPKARFKSVRGPIAPSIRPIKLISHDLSELTKLLGTWCDSDDSHGGQERRAKRIKQGLAGLAQSIRTAVFLFCTHVLDLQADEVIANPRNAHVSTIKTRWSALHPVFAALPLHADPADFDEEDWVGLVDDVNKHCLEMARSGGATDETYVVGDGKLRSSRARDALQRIFRILEADAWEIPQEAWNEMGGATLFKPRLSASSSIYLPEYATAITSEIHEASASSLSADRLDIKVKVMVEAIARIGEISCVGSRCVTGSGAVAFLNTPYTVHKSKHAPRLSPLTSTTAALVRSLEERTLAIAPKAQRLFRFDDIAQAQDVAANAALPELLRRAIGDAEFRPHSLRATAYMESLWPGFRPIVQRLLTGTLTPQECMDWLNGQPMKDRWIQAIDAATAAGHGAVDPGYKFYASAWPLILAIWMKAKSLDLRPAVASFKAFGRTAANLRQVRCRSNDKAIDAWQWLPAAMPRRQHQSLLEIPPPTSPTAPPEVPRPITATPGQTLRYIVLRSLDLAPDEAVHATGLPDTVQKLAEAKTLVAHDVEWARKRKKGGIDGAALDGDRSLALDSAGAGIIEWISGLPDGDIRDLFAMLRRSPRDLSFPLKEIQECGFWRRVSRGMAPGYFLKLRFGEGPHLSPGSALRLKELKPFVEVADERDRDLGPVPDVMLRHIPANDRLDSRSTSIFKLACLARVRPGGASIAAHPAGTEQFSSSLKEPSDA